MIWFHLVLVGLKPSGNVVYCVSLCWYCVLFDLVPKKHHWGKRCSCVDQKMQHHILGDTWHAHLWGCMARLEGSMAYPHGIWIHGTPWGSKAKFEGPMVHIGGSITHLGESITHLGGFTDHLVKFMAHQLGIHGMSREIQGTYQGVTLPQTRSSAWLTFQGFPHGSSKHPYWWPSLCQDHTMMKCINFLPSVTYADGLAASAVLSACVIIGVHLQSDHSHGRQKFHLSCQAASWPWPDRHVPLFPSQTRS